MADKGWKQFERRISRMLGGKRRGADTSDESGGKCDIVLAGYTVECKLYTRPTYQLLLDTLRQAEANRRGEDFPFGIVKRKRDLDKDALVVMRLETLLELLEEEKCDECKTEVV